MSTTHSYRRTGNYNGFEHPPIEGLAPGEQTVIRAGENLGQEQPLCTTVGNTVGGIPERASAEDLLTTTAIPGSCTASTCAVAYHTLRTTELYEITMSKMD